MKYLYIILFSYLLSSCGESVKEISYPATIVENNWESIYDDAKWQLYKHNMNFKVPSSSDTSWYTQLSLDIDVIQSQDTLKMYVKAIDGDEKYRENIKHSIPLFHTIGYSIKYKKLLYIQYDDLYTAEYSTDYEQYDINIMTPKFKKFITKETSQNWLIEQNDKRK